MASYDVVVFDAAGTLVGRDSPDHFEEYFVIAAREVGYVITVDQVRDKVAEIYEDTQKRLAGARMTGPDEARQFWVKLYEEVLRAVGVEGDIREGIGRFYDKFQEGHYLEVYSDVLPTLRGLLESGIRMGVLSNWSEHLENLLERLGIRPYFEFVVVSAIVGVEKPDGRIFDLTVERAGVPHSRILFVGDHPEDDVLASRKAGIDALLLDRHDHHQRHRLPTIKSLTEVNDYVGA